MFESVKRAFGFERRRSWLDMQRANLHLYLARELGVPGDLPEQPVWSLEPHVALWAIPDGWAMTDPTQVLHVVGRGHILRSTRDAARYFGRQFRELTDDARRDGQPRLAESLADRATTLLQAVEQDRGWTEAASHGASDEAEALRDALAAEAGGPFSRSIRVIHDEVAVPGGLFHALYFYLAFAPGQPVAPVFDALARTLIALESHFAPQVAWRIQYALVVFGIDFGEPDREMEVERHADRLRIDHPDLSQKLDLYAATGTLPLAMHFVNSKDVPFTAHPVLGKRAPDYEYSAEAKFFDVRTHPFHQSLEKSGAVGIRLLAGSIAAGVIRRARRAFADGSPGG